MSVASARDDSRGGGVQESLGHGTGAEHGAAGASAKGWFWQALVVAPGAVGQPIKSLAHGGRNRWVILSMPTLREQQAQTEKE